MWPSGQGDHPHLADPYVLKFKYRRRKSGWSRAATVRTNAGRGKQGKSIAPRRRAYGPF